MWSTAERAITISPSPPSQPRLLLRPAHPDGSVRTLLDGGWWPRSADPIAELPGLILALQAPGHVNDRGRIIRLLLAVADWDGRPRRLRVDGPAGTQVVRLGWFDTLPTGLLAAIRADGRRVDLLTVPAATSRAEAWAAMERAAHTYNRQRTPALLAAITSPPVPSAPTERADRAGADPAPENAWESEGGRLLEHLAAPDSSRDGRVSAHARRGWSADRPSP